MNKIINRIKKLTKNEIILIILLLISLTLVIFSWERISTKVTNVINAYSNGIIKTQNDTIKKEINYE